MMDFVKDSDLGIKILAGIGLLWILGTLFEFQFAFSGF